MNNNKSYATQNEILSTIPFLKKHGFRENIGCCRVLIRFPMVCSILKVHTFEIHFIQICISVTCIKDAHKYYLHSKCNLIKYKCMIQISIEMYYKLKIIKTTIVIYILLTKRSFIKMKSKKKKKLLITTTKRGKMIGVLKLWVHLLWSRPFVMIFYVFLCWLILWCSMLLCHILFLNPCLRLCKSLSRTSL